MVDEIKDWSTFEWFSKEMAKGCPIELLSDIACTIRGFAHKIRLISDEYENLKTLKTLEEGNNPNMLENTISHMEDWTNTISQTGSFLEEIGKIKEYIFDNKETKEAHPFLREALSLLDLFCSEGHDFFLGFLPFRKKADTFAKKQKIISAAEYFAAYIKDVDISNRLELATSRLSTYCDTHVRLKPETKIQAETVQREIVEVKPGMFGISLDVKEIGKRIWKWLTVG